MNMQTNQEIFFVAEPESNKIYKFDLVSMQFEFAKHFSKFVIKYCSKQFTIEAHSYISMDQSWLNEPHFYTTWFCHLGCRYSS